MGDGYYISYDKIHDACVLLFVAAGLKKIDALYTADAICTASLRGVDSHGIRLLPHYINAIRAGRINPEAEPIFARNSLSTGCLDAKHGMGHAAVARAMEFVIQLAAETGLGFVVIKNSNHCGSLAYYALKACEKKMIALPFSNATSKLQVFNSTKSFFGLNPLCFTAPMEDEEPFCYDAAPSIMSNNKIKMYMEQGIPLPKDVAADENGEMTIDPGLARMLLPIGGTLAGYKGFALAMVIDILCSLLSGMPNGNDISTMYPNDGGGLSEKRYLGQCVGAIRIDLFEDISVFKKRMKETADAIRALQHSKTATDIIMVPGDPEKRVKKERMEKGIPITKELAQLLKIVI